MHVAAPTTGGAARLDAVIERLRAAGVRVDGAGLARALIDDPALGRLESLIENAGLVGAPSPRIEFICDGPLPASLGEEPAIKSERIYQQEVDYDLCKACRLCIQVCPKRVYSDDGRGHPDAWLRRDAECTGSHQCGQCVDICPENAIRITGIKPEFESTIYVLLPADTAGHDRGAEDFHVANPLDAAIPLALDTRLDPRSLGACNRRLDGAGFHPQLTVRGYPRDFVDEADPSAMLGDWAAEQGRAPALVLEALRLLYRELSRLPGITAGAYALDPILHRIIDELLHAGIGMRGRGARELLAGIVTEARIERAFAGARTRPIGGLLPTGTSPAWKTPYGPEVPEYVHLDRCLGPECGLCVTHCPEGGGGARGAIRIELRVPAATIPALVRGARARLLRLDGSHHAFDDAERLDHERPFDFVVDEDYCKSCGLCISCCPHDVIEARPRSFDLSRGAA